MNFIVTRSSDSLNDKPTEIEISTLEELLDYSKRVGHALIVSTYYYEKNENVERPSIEIYDDYRE